MAWSGAISIFANPFVEFASGYQEAMKDRIATEIKKVQLADMAAKEARAARAEGRTQEAHDLEMKSRRLKLGDDEYFRDADNRLRGLRQNYNEKLLQLNIKEADELLHGGSPSAPTSGSSTNQLHDPRFGARAPAEPTSRPLPYVPGIAIESPPAAQPQATPGIIAPSRPASTNPRGLNMPSPANKPGTLDENDPPALNMGALEDDDFGGKNPFDQSTKLANLSESDFSSPKLNSAPSFDEQDTFSDFGGDYDDVA